MNTSEEIRSKIVVSDEKLKLIKAKYHQQAVKLVESPLLCVVALARLAHVAVSFDDFDLVGMNISSKSNSFIGCIEQIVVESCSAFELAAEKFTEIRMHSDRLPDLIRDRVDQSSDAEMQKEMASLLEAYSDYAGESASVIDKFNKVLALVAEIYVRYTLTTLNTKDPVVEYLDSTRIQLKAGIEIWNYIAKFFTTTCTTEKPFWRDYTMAVRDAQLCDRIAQHLAKISTSAVRIYSLARLYNDTCEWYLESKVKALSKSTKDMPSNKQLLLELRADCSAQVEQTMKIVNSSTEENMENIRSMLKEFRHTNM